MRAASAALCVLLLATSAFAAEKLPPAPTRYFTQYTNVVSPPVAEALNAKLDAFERETSIQLLVAVFPKLPEGAVLEDFAVRAFKEWKVGRAGKDNGAVLFIFVGDRKMKLEVGYGLEGAIPDAVAKQIIEEEIRPAFARGDFDAGVTAGVNAMIRASRGEYRGTGKTVGDRQAHRRLPWPLIIFLLILFFVISSAMRRSGTGYHRRRRSYWGGWPGGFGGGSWGGGGGGWSGGGGGGGVFSGGGGRSGGGGASGSW
jgi:uncharacterized protein